MSGSTDATPENQSLWRPETGPGGPFYTSCDVWPSGDSTADGCHGDQPRGLCFCRGLLRRTLKYIPTVILFAAVLSFTGEQLGTYYTDLGTYLPIGTVLPTPNVLYVPVVALGLLWATALTWLFATTGDEPLDVHKTILFYGTFTAFLAGVGYSIYLVSSGKLTDPRQPLTFRAGYFLFLFLEGHLAYDGLVRRSENLFWNLKDRDVVDDAEYDEFRRRLRRALDSTIHHVPRSTVFAVVLLVPITALPVVSIGVPSPGEAVSYGTITFLQFVLVATLFQFGVLLQFFNELVSGGYLEYKPFHPDEHGGFRDLGRFATRVNVMLVVAGGYVAFRLYTSGLRTLPGDGFASTVDLLNWLVSYIGPLLVYVFVVIMWLYYSFWRIHGQMRDGRRQKIEELQRVAWDTSEETDEHRRMEHPDLDAPVWEALQNAPVWPIRRTSIVGILVVDAIPVLLTLVV